MVLAAALVLSIALVAVAAMLTSPEAGLRSRTRRRCLVSCKDGQTFSGVLWSSDRGCLVLKNAAIVGDSGTAPVDGEVVVLRPEIAFVQFP